MEDNVTQGTVLCVAVLSCNEVPEVQASGYYGHYHDKEHKIYIWFGDPIHYNV